MDHGDQSGRSACPMPTASSGRSRCPLVIVSEVVAANDTLPFAHVRLPAAAWGEKDGTVTNSERVISRQRRFLPTPVRRGPTGGCISEVGRRMGFAAAFDYCGAGRNLPRACDADQPGQRRPPAARSGRPRRSRSRRLRRAGSGPMATATRRGKSTRDASSATGALPRRTGGRALSRRRFAPGRKSPSRAGSPLVLNTGRVRDHWHTMTRTAGSARLSSHFAEPFIEIAPADATARGIAPATLVRVRARVGLCLLRARVSETQRPGSVFVPMHWTDQYASRAHRRAGWTRHRPDLRSARPEAYAGRRSRRRAHAGTDLPCSEAATGADRL